MGQEAALIRAEHLLLGHFDLVKHRLFIRNFFRVGIWSRWPRLAIHNWRSAERYRKFVNINKCKTAIEQILFNAGKVADFLLKQEENYKNEFKTQLDQWKSRLLAFEGNHNKHQNTKVIYNQKVLKLWQKIQNRLRYSLERQYVVSRVFESRIWSWKDWTENWTCIHGIQSDHIVKQNTKINNNLSSNLTFKEFKNKSVTEWISIVCKKNVITNNKIERNK